MVFYLGCHGDPIRDAAEASRRAVLPRSVVLVPVAMAAGHRCNHSNAGQEDNNGGEEKKLHGEGDPQVLEVVLS